MSVDFFLYICSLVLTKLPFSITIYGATQVEEGRGVEVSCAGISNIQPINFVWTSNEGLPISQKGNSLLFPSIFKNQSGTYTCQMTVGAIKKKQSIKIHVNCKSPFFIVFPFLNNFYHFPLSLLIFLSFLNPNKAGLFEGSF